MRVVIDVAAANDRDSIGWLSRILHRFEDGWHLWEVVDGEVLLETAWLRDPGAAGAAAREMLRKSLVRSGYPSRLHGTCIRVSSSARPPIEMTPEDAARFLDQPLTLLVENRESDGAFFDAVVEALGEQELRDLCEQTHAPVVKDSLGGKGEMRKHVQRIAALRPRPRLLLLVDGDGEAPAHVSRDARKLLKTCSELGYPCWILAKREIENYLPASLLEQHPDGSQQTREKLRAWQRLSEEQKDFFDLKHGLARLGRLQGRNFFATLSAADQSCLQSGLGSACTGLWKRRPISAADLRQRAGEELDEFLAFLCANI